MFVKLDFKIDDLIRQNINLFDFFYFNWYKSIR